MFEHFKSYNNIIVSGPQRSGTRITAKIIANDTGKDYIDEKDLNFNDFRLLEWYISKGNSVIQCPALCHLIHNITNTSTLIIMVRRPIDTIINSEAKSWNETSRFQELYKYGRCNGIISQIKYEYWTNFQQSILGDRGKQVYYNKLNTHPLFINKRKNFRWDQTA